MEMMDINSQELKKIIALYSNFIEIKENMERNVNQVIPEEYFLINIKWVEKFKKIFHYEGITNSLEAKIEKLNNLENTIEMKFLPKVSKQEKNEIRIIKNTDIISKSKRFIPYFFEHFYLIKPKYYDILIKDYNIDNRIKYNIFISNKTLVIDLPKDVIEVGTFGSDLSIKKLYLIKFLKEVNLNEEIKYILSHGFTRYLLQFNITEDMLDKNKDIHNEKFGLISLQINQNNPNFAINEINEKENTKILNNFDLSNKKCFTNYDDEGSKLNSIIQILTSNREIYDYCMKKEKIISKLNHIYVFSSFFLEVIKEIYNKDNKKNVSLNKMIIINNFLSPDIGKEDLSDYLSFVLQSLHNELIPFPKNVNQENLISFNSPLEQRESSFAKFDNYYNDKVRNEKNYKSSKISELFNFIIEKKVSCNSNFFISSFQAFPLIIFNIELLFKNPNSNGELTIDLINCFMNYSKVGNKDNNPCIYCHQMHLFYNYIYSSPTYFIIVLQRNNKPNIKIKYSSELDISNYVENPKFKKYKLIGIIMEEGNKYYSVIKNEKEYESNIEEWKIFQGERIIDIKIDKKKKIDKKIYDIIYNQINSRILFYKGFN